MESSQRVSGNPSYGIARLSNVTCVFIFISSVPSLFYVYEYTHESVSKSC